MTEQHDMINDEETKSWSYALENENWITPAIDIFESEINFTLIANMPGVEKENIKVKLEDGHIVIMGRIDYDNLSKRKYILNESEIGNYYRKVKLSNGIDSSTIDAQLINGQLIVQLAKNSNAKKKNIKIQ